MSEIQNNVSSVQSADLLPVGTRIRFTKTLSDGPCEDHPGQLYARAGDVGEITDHGCPEGYWVKRDVWPHAFGASRDEFELEACTICGTTKRTPAGYLDCNCDRSAA